MDPVISGLLDDLPDKPPRSKLEAHADVIAALRRKRRTYREIAHFFREHLSITVAPSTIHDFVRVRRGREKQKGNLNLSDRKQRVSRDKATEPASQADEDALQRIAALKRRAPAPEPKPLFTYRDDEPLKLSRKPPSSGTD